MKEPGTADDNLARFLSHFIRDDSIDPPPHPFFVVTLQSQCATCHYSSRLRFNEKLHNISGANIPGDRSHIAILDPFDRFRLMYAFRGSRARIDSFCPRCYNPEATNGPQLRSITERTQYWPPQQSRWSTSCDAPPILAMRCDENALTQCTSFKVDEIRTIHVPASLHDLDTSTIAFHYKLGCVIEMSDVLQGDILVAHYRTKVRDDDSPTKWLCYDGLEPRTEQQGVGTICEPPDKLVHGWNVVVFMYMSFNLRQQYSI